MKTAKLTVLPLLFAAAAVGMLLVSLPFGFCALATSGVLAIAFRDYRRVIKPLRAPLARVAPFRRAVEMPLAA